MEKWMSPFSSVELLITCNKLPVFKTEINNRRIPFLFKMSAFDISKTTINPIIPEWIPHGLIFNNPYDFNSQTFNINEFKLEIENGKEYVGIQGVLSFTSKMHKIAFKMKKDY